ncbi:hypothetical protein FACS1894207_3220 [Bacteroidia bacterium]|nr:hypothetical protein FACS1894207_3220 [Bacteroidia bacterium]
MKRKEAKSFVKESLSPLLGKDGYKYVNWAEEFHFKMDDFTYQIGWGCVERWNSCEISFYMNMRSERVSKIFNLFSGADPKYHRELSTFGFPFGYFTGEKLNSYISVSVSDSTKEKDVVNSFLPVYEKKVKPFFEEYSSLEKISSFMLYAIDNDKIWGDEYSYYITSIIILKLTNSPFFAERTKFYQDILKEFSERQQESFNKVIDYLKSI